MSAAIECLQCGERQDAIRASQGTPNPIFCGAVDYFGETLWDAERHRFRDRSDRELIEMGVLPEYTHLYRRVMNGYEIADDHMVTKEASV